MNHVENFPVQSFYQILLDTPRLKTSQQGIKCADRLFKNYTKRNSISSYLQSHSAIGTRIIDVVLKKKYYSEIADEYIFWLYVSVREVLLPLGYFNMLIEAALVNTSVFNYLFKKLDPNNYEILGEIPGCVFQRHFCSLFTETHDSLAYAVLDLIFSFGSGCMRGTVVEGESPISDQHPLCRT